VTPCGLLDRHQHFRNLLLLQSSEMSTRMKHKVTHCLKLLVLVYRTIWCHICEDHNLNISTKGLGHATVQVVRHQQPLTMQAWDAYQANPCGTTSGKTDTGRGTGTWLLPYQDHATIVPHYRWICLITNAIKHWLYALS